MATHFEVFDKLRGLGRSLDEISSSLPADGDAEDTNRARACLQLKALLTEAKHFKEETSKSIADARGNYSLDSTLELYEKQAHKLREDIENLENHLANYGYKIPTEKLAELQGDSSDEGCSEAGDQYDSESPQRSSSDKENQSPRSETEQSKQNALSEPEEELPKQSQPEEVDFLATPVRPTTVTKFIQNFNPKNGNPISLQADEDLHPPITVTPLLKSNPENSGFSTPETLESPAQPMTQTPMIKAAINFDSPNNVSSEEDTFAVEDFPTPPTFATPGIKRYGTRANSVETPVHYDAISTPSPPRFTNVSRLNPDDLVFSGPTQISSRAIKHLPAAEPELPRETTYHLPDINYEIYQRLPDSIQRQFSLEQLNRLIRQTDAYINTRSQDMSAMVTDEELMSVLHLGPFTRVFALAMLKLEYFTVKRSGIYSVHSKMVV